MSGGIHVGIGPDEKIHVRMRPLSERCTVCWRLSHAKWHECAKGDLNPVAIIQFVERLGDNETTRAVVGWVTAMTGIDERAMREMLRAEAQDRHEVARTVEPSKLERTNVSTQNRCSDDRSA